jgi:hypothetical protein
MLRKQEKWKRYLFRVFAERELSTKYGKIENIRIPYDAFGKQSDKYYGFLTMQNIATHPQLLNDIQHMKFMFGEMELVFTMALSHRPRLNIPTTSFAQTSQQAINEMRNQFSYQISNSTTDEPSRKRAKESDDIIELKTETNDNNNDPRYEREKNNLKKWEKHLQETEDYQLYRFEEFERREDQLDEREELLNKKERKYNIWKTKANETAVQLKQKETECLKLKLELDEKDIRLQEQRDLIKELEKISKEKLFEVELNSVDAELKALTVRRADLVNNLEQLNEKKQSNK